ncbi:MAG: hypothetical protein WDZ39_01090 [Candidatus Spechtbacterales bacterium]
MIKTKILLYSFVAVAVVAALSAVFIPSFGEQKQRGAQEVFIEPDEVISSRTEISYKDGDRKPDSAHFLGERFYLTFVIQYRDDKIEPALMSVSNTSLHPLEFIGEAQITHEEVSDKISEYRYKLEVMTVEALPGHAYTIDEINLAYTVLSSGDTEALDVSPAHAFQTGQYGTAVPRPHMDALRDNFELRQWLLLIAFYLFLFAAILIIYLNIERAAASREDASWDVAESEHLISMLGKYKDKQWIEEESVRKRMSELRPIILKLLYMNLNMSPYKFWTQKNDYALKKIRESMRPAFTKSDPKYGDVIELATRAEKYLLAPENERGE